LPSLGISPGSVRLLRQIRDVMAREGDPQERLDRLVRLIAANMVAEVCSIYLRRGGGAMELCATEGLKREAVHRLRMAPGEGLVGVVARTAEPVSLSDAPLHPKFSYHPETGEDPYHSFLGVPILRGGRLLGVLVVQNRAERIYEEEEVETLQTIAMVLAEVIGSSELAEEPELAGIEIRPSKPELMAGRGFADGLAIGPAYVLAPHVAPTRLIAEDPAAEEARLGAGLAELRSTLDQLVDGDGRPEGGVTREVLETYRMFARDPKWVARLHDAVRAGLTAEAAVERARNEQRARMANARDAYLRDRLHDLEDLANRLLRHLSGNAVAPPPPPGAILIARQIGPAELLELGPQGLGGIALEEGSAGAHATIVARALGIPMVGRLEGLLDRTEEGDIVVLDGRTGEVHLRPGEEVLDAYHARIELRGQRQRAYARLRGRKARTRDGRDLQLMLNAGLIVDLPQIEATGADGIGLFRTEFQFMIADRLPKQDDQIEVYSQVVAAAGDKPVVFRTLDLGGDKILPYLASERERNPAMGWRAIRMSLDRQGLLRYQLRALMTATAGRELHVMFPLVATPAEFCAARDIALKELNWAKARGRPTPDRMRVGVMVETPALAFGVDAILGDADFVSVGANDLFQFFYAVDRENARLSDRYDILDRGFINILKHIADKCAARGVVAGVCGEMAGRPLEAAALAALGFPRLSMPAGGIGPVKQALLELDTADLGSVIEDFLHNSSLPQLRNVLQDYAAKRDLPY
jgi:phosphotransferase system enzyme I (PtsP)